MVFPFICLIHSGAKTQKHSHTRTDTHTPTCPADWKAARISGSSLKVKGGGVDEVAIATTGGCCFYWRKKISSAYPLISLSFHSLSPPFSLCLTYLFSFLCIHFICHRLTWTARDIYRRHANSSHVDFLQAHAYCNVAEEICGVMCDDLSCSMGFYGGINVNMNREIATYFKDSSCIMLAETVTHRLLFPLHFIETTNKVCLQRPNSDSVIWDFVSDKIQACEFCSNVCLLY